MTTVYVSRDLQTTINLRYVVAVRKCPAGHGIEAVPVTVVYLRDNHTLEMPLDEYEHLGQALVRYSEGLE